MIHFFVLFFQQWRFPGAARGHLRLFAAAGGSSLVVEISRYGGVHSWLVFVTEISTPKSLVLMIFSYKMNLMIIFHYKIHLSQKI